MFIQFIKSNLSEEMYTLLKSEEIQDKDKLYLVMD